MQRTDPGQPTQRRDGSQCANDDAKGNEGSVTMDDDRPLSAKCFTQTDDDGYMMVTVTFARPEGGEVSILVHESLVKPGRVNIEIDGEFDDDNPYDELTVHVNDRSVACFTDRVDD